MPGSMASYRKWREGDAQLYSGHLVGKSLLIDESLTKMANNFLKCHNVRHLKPDRWPPSDLWENTYVFPWNEMGIRQWRPLKTKPRAPSSHTLRQHEKLELSQSGDAPLQQVPIANKAQVDKTMDVPYRHHHQRLRY